MSSNNDEMDVDSGRNTLTQYVSNEHRGEDNVDQGTNTLTQDVSNLLNFLVAQPPLELRAGSGDLHDIPNGLRIENTMPHTIHSSLGPLGPLSKKDKMDVG